MSWSERWENWMINVGAFCGEFIPVMLIIMLVCSCIIFAVGAWKMLMWVLSL